MEPLKDSQAVRDFMKAMEEEFGEKLTYEEARVRMLELLEFFRLISRPIPPKEGDQLPLKGI